MEGIGSLIKTRCNHRQTHAGPPWHRFESVECSADYWTVSGSVKYGIEKKRFSLKWNIFLKCGAFGTIWPSDDRPCPQDWYSNIILHIAYYVGENISNQLTECISVKFILTAMQEIKKCKYFSLFAPRIHKWCSLQSQFSARTPPCWTSSSSTFLALMVRLWLGSEGEVGLELVELD